MDFNGTQLQIQVSRLCFVLVSVSTPGGKKNVGHSLAWPHHHFCKAKKRERARVKECSENKRTMHWRNEGWGPPSLSDSLSLSLCLLSPTLGYKLTLACCGLKIARLQKLFIHLGFSVVPKQAIILPGLNSCETFARVLPFTDGVR